MRNTKRFFLSAALVFLAASALSAGLPDGLKCKTFYDTTRVRFDGIMWFEEIPGKPGVFLVAEQNGKLWAFEAATAAKTLFMDFPSFSQTGYHETGLMGLAFHPRFRENRKIYAYYNPSAKRSELQIGEIVADATLLKDSGTPLKVIYAMPNQGSHNGSTVAFGPDGFLYFAKGQDHGMPGTAQDLKSTRGKMFRIDVDHPEGGKAYRVPSDNPYADGAGGALKEIWAYGLRNPMKFSFDPLNGELWQTEVGQWFFEDVNLIHRGDNLGWDKMEGPNCYSWSDEFKPATGCQKAGLVEPIWSISHANPKDPWGNSGTGGLVYRGNPASGFHGAYFVGDFCSKQMFALRKEGGKLAEAKEYARLPLGPSHFAAASDGKVYFSGWYQSSVYLSQDRSSQILVLDHPDLLLGPSELRRRGPGSAARLAAAGNPGVAVRLDGVPVSFVAVRTASGREARAYFADGKAR